jgi:hypothetical protein
MWRYNFLGSLMICSTSVVSSIHALVFVRWSATWVVARWVVPTFYPIIIIFVRASAAAAWRVTASFGLSRPTLTSLLIVLRTHPRVLTISSVVAVSWLLPWCVRWGPLSDTRGTWVVSYTVIFRLTWILSRIFFTATIVMLLASTWVLALLEARSQKFRRGRELSYVLSSGSFLVKFLITALTQKLFTVWTIFSAFILLALITHSNSPVRTLLGTLRGWFEIRFSGMGLVVALGAEVGIARDTQAI